MNFSNTVGLIISTLVLGAAILTSTDDLSIFFDTHALLIVVGGTGAAASVCFSIPKLWDLTKVFFKKIIGARQRDFQSLLTQLVELSTAKHRGIRHYENAVNSGVTDPFLKDASEVLFWLEADVPAEHLRDLLETRTGTHYEQYMEDANMFRTLAKFPPAFGLLGTTLAMIVLLGSLGSDVSQSSIGPAMAIGLVATLYGVVLANLVFLPIAENLTRQTKEDLVARRIVVEGIMLIYERLPTSFVEEKLKSYLLPKDRIKVHRDTPSTSATAGGNERYKQSA